MKKDRALIVFTRVPIPGRTKTRMSPYLSAEECAEIHRCFLRDIAPRCRSTGSDLFVYYTGGEPAELAEIFGREPAYRMQSEGDVGLRMRFAMEEVLAEGYDRCILIGADIPELSAETLEEAFGLLSGADTVFTPTAEGGYCLVGCRAVRGEIFEIEGYGGDSVLDDTLAACRRAGLSYALTKNPPSGGGFAVSEPYHDLDDRADIADFRERMRGDEILRRSETARFIADKTSISIVVPVYNEADGIESFMELLEPFADDAEIVFVDGGSGDGTPDLIGERFSVGSSKKGRAVQMNAGAAITDGDVLLFLHADSLKLPDGMLGELRRVMTEHSCGCFHVDFPSDKLLMRTNEAMSNRRASRGVMFGDQGIFIDRRLFDELGGYREIPIMEDFDLSIRLRERGIKPGMAEGTIITSDRRFGESTSEIARTEYEMWRLRRRFLSGEDPELLSQEYKDVR